MSDVNCLSPLSILLKVDWSISNKAANFHKGNSALSLNFLINNPNFSNIFLKKLN
jgi:hypothetical protein